MGLSTLRRDAPLSDSAMIEYIKRLAQTGRPHNRARLNMSSINQKLLSRLRREAATLRGEDETPAMEWFIDNARLVDAQITAVLQEKGEKLPSWGRLPRVQQLMHELVAHSDAHIDETMLMASIKVFDEAQPLTMAELWAAPMALRVELIAAFIDTAERIVEAKRDRKLAEDWIKLGAKPDLILSRRMSNTFFEHALQLLHEQEMPGARRMLEEYLERREAGANSAIQIAHAEAAMQRLLMSGIMGTLRMLDGLNWLNCFTVLSGTDNVLMDDPANVYQQMDERSQATVRDELASLAEVSGLSEITIARGAHKLASADVSVCEFLYTDGGRLKLLASLDVPEVKPKKLVPDPSGRRYLTWIALLSVAFWCLFFESERSLLLAIISLPLAWHYAASIINHVCARLVRPRPLLKLDIKDTPDDMRTLIVIPALLSSEQSTRDVCGQLEALGWQQRDKNIDLLLLGDLKDGPNEHEDSDTGIVQTARDEVARMNELCGRDKFFFLCRERKFCEVQKNYMGHERKRGALMELNKLLTSGEGEFEAEGARAGELYARGYRFVTPLDAGTGMLPGTMHKLIGALAHPLNRSRVEGGTKRGYALLQPRMEHAAPSELNRFQYLMAGLGGVPSYPACVSDVYQDMSGVGIFGGKGIYELSTFDDALKDALPDGAILSHDLIEGLISGAGQLNDVALFDEFPKTPKGYLSRLNRWTRGDWQLLPFIGKLQLPLFGLYLMIDNLRRSLTPVAALTSMIVGIWLGNAPAVLVGLIYPFVPAILALPRFRKRDWLSCALRLSILPAECYQLVDAIIRTLYRLFVSHINLLSWVTAADADRGADGNMLTLPCRIAAILLIPALFRPEFTVIGMALAALFLSVGLQIRSMERDSLSDGDRRMLLELAASTWRFFETQVTLGGTGLPPDNIQLSPKIGAARRTSPTNIGLYMAAVLSAYKLGFIDYAVLEKRLSKTVQTLQKLPKWHGQLYNWYDIDTLEPLQPRYVSAVDGGNLAACLMLCSEALTIGDMGRKAELLARKMEQLFNDMEFEALYDKKRKLFVIGVDVDHERLSQSHYDLLASESRILSYVAMALSKVDYDHWARLGRSASNVEGVGALMSWSGTMFEYMMPEMFMRSPKYSLLGATNRAAVRSQIAAGGPIWGVSESGYNAFDMMMNYQYKAFGLPRLALRGDAFERVYAPYASVIALPVMPCEVVTNIRRMYESGLVGDMGLYEAVDASPVRLSEREEYHVVKSYMAHHQGMILCALTNALEDDYIVKTFMNRADARALSLMLAERQADVSPRRALRKDGVRQVARPELGANTRRRGDPLSAIPDSHLLFGGGGTRFTSANGRGFFRVNGIMVNRFMLNTGSDEGIYVHARIIGRGQRFILNGGAQSLDKKLSRRVSFDAGHATWSTVSEELSIKLQECVSPEDGALLQHIEIINRSQRIQKLELTGAFAVSMSNQADIMAHPVFQNLFVESAQAGECALVFRRRPRDERQCPMLAHIMYGVKDEPVSVETDLQALIGRDGALDRVGGLAKKLSGSLGRVLNPCSALRVRLELLPGEMREIGYVIAVKDDENELLKLISSYLTGGAARRAQNLSRTQALAMLSFLSMSNQRHQLLQRSASFLMLPNLKFFENEPPASCQISALWALGISGDLPIITAFISGKDQLELAREAVRAHEFYRQMGVWCDLVLVNEYGNNYEQPVRDALLNIVQSSHLRELINEAGGAFQLEGATLTDTQRQLLRSVAAIALIGGDGNLNAQLSRRLQRKPELPPPPKPFPKSDTPLEHIERTHDNGWGGFSPDGKRYIIELAPGGTPTPAPWCNIIANPNFGTLITERGGGFTWSGSSRSGRLTPFVNDPLSEGFSERIFLHEGARRISLMPEHEGVRSRFRVIHEPGSTTFESEVDALRWNLCITVDDSRPLKRFDLKLQNMSQDARELSIKPQIDFLMGTSLDDLRLRTVTEEGEMIFARGALSGVGFFAPSSHDVVLAPGACHRLELLLGWANDPLEARALLGAPRSTRDAWVERLPELVLETPDTMLNAMVSNWLPYQTLSSRVFGRTGLYQGGGAYGFRDQLQDMLCLIPLMPELVRSHILLSAAHQFEEGDVMHWWHPERTGVRTRITDDMLFLPYVVHKYAIETGDHSILLESVPYLKADELKDGEHDCYQTPAVSDLSESVMDHCLKAIRRANRRGEHNLALIGGGDWNDGMDSVGVGGKGESVWLSEFLAVVADEFIELLDEGAQEAGELRAISDELKAAVEQYGWDGEWYLRAYYDNGAKLGSHECTQKDGCRIDAIAQAWAVMAHLNDERTRMAMNSAVDELFDEDNMLIKLLTPPFDAPENVPGYIMGYPPGIRENGGQYTHAACWFVMALAELGMAERAWQAVDMLMPYNHSSSSAEAQVYRVEPYVIAADVYSEPPNAGRGGWTWYTGAAAWMCRVMTRYIMGYQRMGDVATMRALLRPDWTEARLIVSYGSSRYVLISRRGQQSVELDGHEVAGEYIQLVDDGSEHIAIFPCR